MPYITDEEKLMLKNNGGVAKTSGQLNYLITLLMDSYTHNYESYNDVTLACEYVVFELMTQGEPTSVFHNDFHHGMVDLIMKSDVPAHKCVGAVKNALLELYRRKAADYEDAKRKENGDVYNQVD